MRNKLEWMGMLPEICKCQVEYPQKWPIHKGIGQNEFGWIHLNIWELAKWKHSFGLKVADYHGRWPQLENEFFGLHQQIDKMVIA